MQKLSRLLLPRRSDVRASLPGLRAALALPSRGRRRWLRRSHAGRARAAALYSVATPRRRVSNTLRHPMTELNSSDVECAVSYPILSPPKVGENTVDGGLYIRMEPAASKLAAAVVAMCFAAVLSRRLGRQLDQPSRRFGEFECR
jgi:hypothetical protein